MKKNDIRVEAPKKTGEDAEFFLQTTPPRSISCHVHIHNAVEMLYVKEGSYNVSLDDSEYYIERGDLILFCSNAIHHVVTLGEAQNTYYVIKIPPSFFIDSSKHGSDYVMRFALNRKGNKCLWKSSELEGSDIKAILDSLITEYEEKRYACEVAIKLKIMELLLTVLRESAPTSIGLSNSVTQPIYNVMSYVQEHFAEDIDEKKLASEFGMSYSYFSRSFKRVTGMTFKNYLNRTRINKAEQLLFLRGNTISDVATACGYNSISYFISVYRSVTGKTPYKSLKDSEK